MCVSRVLSRNTLQNRRAGRWLWGGLGNRGNGRAGVPHDSGWTTNLLPRTELNALQEELKAYGLVILGFPCNQFGKQEPGDNSEILPGLKHVRPGGGFVPNFLLFEKGDVNGDKEQKVFTFLKNSCPPPAELLGDPSRLFWSPMKTHDIRWNFEKFLVGPDGVPVMRWYHRATVSTVKADIVRYLRKLNNEQVEEEGRWKK
uniref:Glutathione peroxidase n=1 Tax=Ornithorhynchus anatinus TaxID=9258 RepID=A0A6I8PM39_ORNAN